MRTAPRRGFSVAILAMSPCSSLLIRGRPGCRARHFHVQYVRHAVRRVLTDNARNYTVARVFLAVADANGLTLKLTRPYRPQTNGKAERFIQTLLNEWAYARPYRSNAERLHQLPRWLYRYNHRRPRGGGRRGRPRLPPVNNLPGKYN